ncbi:MAG: hypothetical protein ABIV63_09630, partial [Caldimonas sp.]
ANPAADQALIRQQSESLPTVQQAAATVLGVAPLRVEVRSLAHQLTVSVVDATDANASSRSHDAEAVVGSVERAIDGHRGFDQVMLIHVDFVSHHGKGGRILKGFDFNRSPSGSFVPHKT